MSNTVRVVLLKGTKGKREWEHEDLRSAMIRAYALSDLHNTSISTRNPNELIVDASEYYTGKPKGAPTRNDGFGLTWDEE